MTMPARIGSRGLGGARGFERAVLDYYPTAPKLTRALLAAEQFRGSIWEPACGDGAISKIIAGSGKDVISTDIARYGYGRKGIDFLRTKSLRAPNIVTNPPFKLWDEFAAHALSLRAAKLCLLGRLLLLEGWDRAEFFARTELSRVIVVGRAKMLPPGVLDKGYGPMICFAWFVWERTAPRRRHPSIVWHRPERDVR